ncbi:efflux system transcriptional repressor MexL [Stakelama sediminis]|uniref:TetR/AcrR family transcriptional repressor of mexJK operon n=1 Tax=Stakelama sediminis TaxID=463200 RepID=A0A840Z174_9SPHN|nr:TetR/AcrR family transcriptional regulator [Stakelama sediminis]MBB5719480.1 TetR/AcrR family transcriptional repressor of mexJK operon [Stakelama sediminis]
MDHKLCCKRQRRAGRPPDPAKDAAILRAARELFFARGFVATTIEDIAQEAAVSKVTVYKRYGDKETLFEQALRTEVDNMAQAFEIGDQSASGLEERLNAFGIKLMRFVFRPKHVALDRVSAQVFMQMPELGRRVYDAGVGQIRHYLSNALEEACDRGILVCDNPELAAEDLHSLWRGFTDVELKFGARKHIDDEIIEQRVRHGTRTFLRAYDGHTA